MILNHILQSLAIKYPYVKFLKIISTEAKPDYDDVGLPSLLVYQGGNLLQCWVPITVKLGKNFEAANVELLLARYISCTIASSVTHLCFTGQTSSNQLQLIKLESSTEIRGLMKCANMILRTTVMKVKTTIRGCIYCNCTILIKILLNLC